jgi:altronate hydrolase
MSTQRWIITHDADSVAIALSPLDAGEMVGAVTLLEAIPAGHKFALKAIATGDAIQKLGHSIGRAKSDIAAGTHVHDHVLEFAGRTDRSSIGTDIRPKSRPVSTAMCAPIAALAHAIILAS